LSGRDRPCYERRVQWAGAVTVVTGASSGIGRATAVALAARGARVMAVARRQSLLDELVRECGPQTEALPADLGDRAAAEGVVAETLRRHGRLDVLVNNAAMPKHKHALRLDADEVERVLRVNFLSAVWTTLAALPHMVARGAGAVVNVSSVAAAVVPPREAAYAASKAALNAFSEGLWHDLAGSGVHVALVHPGPIDTEIWEKTDEPAAYRGRRWPASDVADAILDVVTRRRHEVTVPAHNPALFTARLLRLLWPGLLRRGMARMDPVPPGTFPPRRGPA
jgi:short-subunit dehydrogenase